MREMLRIKRSVQAKYNTQVNMMSAQMLNSATNQTSASIDAMSLLDKESGKSFFILLISIEIEPFSNIFAIKLKKLLRHLDLKMLSDLYGVQRKEAKRQNLTSQILMKLTLIWTKMTKEKTMTLK